MIYFKFNQFIKDKYFSSEKIGSYIVLSVDQYVIDEFCLKHNTSVQQLKDEFGLLFSKSWESGLKEENFFGLLAIQVYVAHSMGEKDGYAKKEYNPRLENILKVSIDQSLNIEKLYSDYQVRIWNKLRDWCEERRFFIEIPMPRKYTGCYIQYPLSQALLNQNDLDRLPLFFSINWIKPFNRIAFCEFCYVIKELETKQKNILSAHFFQVKARLQKYRDGVLLDLLYRQVFDYYCNWDGEIPELEIKIGKGFVNLQELLNNKNILIYNEHSIQVLDNKYNLLETINIDTNDLFQRIKKRYRLSHADTEFVFFIKDEYDDWVETKYLEAGSNNLIILRNANALIYSLKQKNPESKITSFKYFSTIEIELPQGYEAEGWLGRHLKERRKPFIVENGLKLDRKTWMFQAGPDIKFEKVVDAWLITSEVTSNIEKFDLTDTKLTKSLKSYPLGQYVLAVRDFGSFKFEINEPSINSTECANGWKINTKPAIWKPDLEQFQICGLLNSFSTEQGIKSEIRDWIHANSSQRQNVKKSNNNINTKAINRSKYGIRY